MTALWIDLSIRAGDLLLAWLLILPRDLSLVLLSALTSMVLLVLRRWLTNQQLLKLARQDLRRLRECLRNARAAGDRQALSRYRNTRAKVLRLRFLLELRPVCFSLIPLAMVVTWGNARMNYLPLAENETTTLVLDTPVADAGEVVHLVPTEGVTVTSGWLTKLEETSLDGKRQAQATWNIHATSSGQGYDLKIRRGKQTVSHHLSVGLTIHSQVARRHGEQVETRIRLQRYVPFGFLPGIEFIAIPAWMVGYIALTAIFYFGLRRLLRME